MMASTITTLPGAPVPAGRAPEAAALSGCSFVDALDAVSSAEVKAAAGSNGAAPGATTGAASGTAGAQWRALVAAFRISPVPGAKAGASSEPSIGAAASVPVASDVSITGSNGQASAAIGMARPNRDGGGSDELPATADANGRAVMPPGDMPSQDIASSGAAGRDPDVAGTASVSAGQAAPRTKPARLPAGGSGKDDATTPADPVAANVAPAPPPMPAAQIAAAGFGASGAAVAAHDPASDSSVLSDAAGGRRSADLSTAAAGTGLRSTVPADAGMGAETRATRNVPDAGQAGEEADPSPIPAQTGPAQTGLAQAGPARASAMGHFAAQAVWLPPVAPGSAQAGRAARPVGAEQPAALAAGEAAEPAQRVETPLQAAVPQAAGTPWPAEPQSDDPGKAPSRGTAGDPLLQVSAAGAAAVIPVIPTEAAPVAAPAHAAAGGAPPAAEQVAAAVVHIARSPESNPQVTLHLQPNELGPVQVRIERTATGLTHIEITAAKPETLAALQNSQAQLHQSLDLAGVPAAGRTVTFHLPEAPPAPTAATAGFADAAGFGAGQAGTQGGAQSDSGGQYDSGRGGYSGQQRQSQADDTMEQVAPAAVASLPRSYRIGLDITA